MPAEPQYKLCPKCRSIYAASAKVCGQDRTELCISDDIVAGRYVKVSLLGRGAMGTVYEAWEPALKRRVALKLLNIGTDLWKYYERETEALGRLTDEHIVTVYERGRDEPYIAMEFLDGKSLDKHLAESGPLPLRTAFRLWRQAVRGIMVAHKAGIVHRDLKPANLFLTHRYDDSGQKADLIKVLDFGIAIVDEDYAKRVAKGSDQTKNIGTIGFAAPEQWRHGRATAASDVYSLGVVLLSMLTGKQGFSNPLRALEKAFELMPVSLELNQLGLDTLAQEPSARPANAEVLLQRIGTLPEIRDPARFWPEQPLLASPSASSLADYPDAAGLASSRESGKLRRGSDSPASRPSPAAATPRPATPPTRVVASDTQVEPADSENETEQMRATQIPLPMGQASQSEVRLPGMRVAKDADEGSTNKLPRRAPAEPASAGDEAAVKVVNLKDRPTWVSVGRAAPAAELVPPPMAQTLVAALPQPAAEVESDVMTQVTWPATIPPLPAGREQLGALSKAPLARRWRWLGPTLVGGGLTLGAVLLATSGAKPPNGQIARADLSVSSTAPLSPSIVPMVTPPLSSGSPSLPEPQPARPLTTKPATAARPGALRVRFSFCSGVKFICGDRKVKQLSAGSFEVNLQHSDSCTAEGNQNSEHFSYSDIRKHAGLPDQSGIYHIVRHDRSELCH